MSSHLANNTVRPERTLSLSKGKSKDDQDRLRGSGVEGLTCYMALFGFAAYAVTLRVSGSGGRLFILLGS
ncbi:MAG TPA: hypothetical protein VGX03_16840 [Candidatus Binatia bacterium]|nr:hypothetical protein [Candidatus Binatia bacterium]